MADSAREVENLLYAYAERIDAGNFESVADLFQHGRIQSGPDASSAAISEGRASVLALYRSAVRLYEDGTPRTRHVTTNAIVDVDEEAHRATARSYYTVFQKTDDRPLQAIVCGRYHDTFQHIDGEWWFETRVIFIDLIGDLSRHLLFDLR